MPSIPGSQPIPGGDEDCLFLNVYAPPNAQNLPVLVYIHEGGYGFGDGTRDLSDFINANEKGVIGVTIQYRVRSSHGNSDGRHTNLFTSSVPSAGFRLLK